MSQNLRVVLADTEMTWSGQTLYMRKGTIVDIQPGPASKPPTAAHSTCATRPPPGTRARPQRAGELSNVYRSWSPLRQALQKLAGCLGDVVRRSMSATVPSWPRPG